jgi:hypothetical protein
MKYVKNLLPPRYIFAYNKSSFNISSGQLKCNNKEQKFSF